MTATTTQTKKTKIDESRPPHDVRENTKARRAWLADELARVNAIEGREGKIVGNGSYQSVSIYKVEEVAARIQIRGTCQFCGGDQAVEGTTIVLHGYKRPRWGYVIGRCDGTHRQPAEKEIKHTNGIIAHLAEEITQLQEVRLVEAKKVARAALEAMPQYSNEIRAEWLEASETREAAEKTVRSIQNDIWNREQYRDHLTKYVVPQFGKPLREVKVV